MNFAAYIQQQKCAIRTRHEGETYMVDADGVTALRSTEEIFRELDGMKGLNRVEREGYFTIRRTCTFAE